MVIHLKQEQQKAASVNIILQNAGSDNLSIRLSVIDEDESKSNGQDLLNIVL